MKNSYVKIALKLLLSLFFVFLILYTFTAQQTEENLTLLKDPEVFYSSKDVFLGDLFSLYLENISEEDVIDLDFPLLDKPLEFYPYKEGKTAFIGITYHVTPGEYPIIIRIKRPSGIILKTTDIITVLPKKFTRQYLYVTEELAAKRDDRLLAKDAQYVNKAKSETFTEPLFTGPFIIPLQGRISTEYGLTRYINSKLSGRHAGLDIAAPQGTPVKASNGGRITLAKGLYVTGNTIIIDHGLNIFTAYCHLHKMLVKEGAVVKKGDIIGTIGSTGFSTGPHLHWTMSIGSTFTNPRIFFAEEPLSWLREKKP